MTDVDDDRWADPYRWACPAGHVFQRRFDPAGAIECYTCQRTYDAADLVDRRTERADPPWALDRDGSDDRSDGGDGSQPPN